MLWLPEIFPLNTKTLKSTAGTKMTDLGSLGRNMEAAGFRTTTLIPKANYIIYLIPEQKLEFGVSKPATFLVLKPVTK